MAMRKAAHGRASSRVSSSMAMVGTAMIGGEEGR